MNTGFAHVRYVPIDPIPLLLELQAMPNHVVKASDFCSTVVAALPIQQTHAVEVVLARRRSHLDYYYAHGFVFIALDIVILRCLIFHLADGSVELLGASLNAYALMAALYVCTSRTRPFCHISQGAPTLCLTAWPSDMH